MKLDSNMRLKIVCALTEYDRKQSTRKGYNPYALPLYLGSLHRVEQLASLSENLATFELRRLFVRFFCDRVLDVVLKAIGQVKSTDEENRL